MDEQEFKKRTKQMALRVIRLVEALPKSQTADVIAKLCIVEEEADESLYWMELLIEADIVPATKLKSLMSEINEVLAMTVASIKTLRSKARQTPMPNSKSKID